MLQVRSIMLTVLVLAGVLRGLRGQDRHAAQPAVAQGEDLQVALEDQPQGACPPVVLPALLHSLPATGWPLSLALPSACTAASCSALMRDAAQSWAKPASGKVKPRCCAGGGEA